MAFYCLQIIVILYNLQEGIYIFDTVTLLFMLLPLLMFFTIIENLNNTKRVNRTLLSFLTIIIVLKIASCMALFSTGVNPNYNALLKSIMYIFTIYFVASILNSKFRHYHFLKVIIISFMICNISLCLSYLLYYFADIKSILEGIILFSRAQEIKMIGMNHFDLLADYINRDGILRLSFGNAVNYAIINVLTVPMVFFLITKSIKNNKRWELMLFSMSMLFIIIAIMMTLSRMSMLLFFITIIICIFNMNKKEYPHFTITVAILLIVTLFVGFVILSGDHLSNNVLSNRFNLLDPNFWEFDPSVTLRLFVLSTSYEIFLSNPIIGIGIGNIFQQLGMSSESMLFQMLAEEGLLNTISLYGMFILLLSKVNKYGCNVDPLLKKIYSTTIVVYFICGIFHPIQFEVFSYILLGACFSNYFLISKALPNVKTKHTDKLQFA